MKPLSNEPIKVLLIEDNAGDAMLMRKALGDPGALSSARVQFYLICAERLSVGLKLLAAEQIDIILLDLSLPDSEGLATFLRLRDCAHGVPVVILSALDDETVGMQALHEGAQDYLIKGQASADSIRRVIQYAIERKHSQDALRRAHEELELRVQERTMDLQRINEVLQAEMAERRRVEEQIAAALYEKTVLLKEIHHRVKNNLQIISSLLTLQSHHIRDGKGPFDVVRASQQRIRSMALIHERLYQSENLSKIHAEEYLRMLAENIFVTFGMTGSRVSLTVDAVASWTPETAIPCGLIVNELVSNSLKHAFPHGRNGRIHITAHCKDKVCAMSVTDDGEGFPPHLNYRETESLGMQLVMTLVDQLGGTIELRRTNGTAFHTTFPMK